MLRGIFRPEKDKVTEQRRRLQIENFSDYYRLSGKSRNMWVAPLSCIEEKINEPRVWW